MLKNNFFYFFFFIFLKILLLLYIYLNRSLPVEPDDAFFYFSHVSAFYDDFDRQNLSYTSLKEIIVNTINYGSIDDYQPLGRLERLMIQRYFAYSVIVGFFTEIIGSNMIFSWWILYFLLHFLILLSFYKIFFIFSSKSDNKIFLFLLLSFFSFLAIKHHLVLTPISFGNCLLLISWFYIHKSKDFQFIKLLLPSVGYFISLHFHPGVIIISYSICLGYFLCIIFAKRDVDLLRKLVLIFFLTCSTIFIEYFLKTFFDIKTYLGIFENVYIDHIKNDFNLIDIFLYNYQKLAYNFLNLFTIFSFQIQILGVILYFYGLKIIYRNYFLFYINISFLIITIISVFHYEPSHPGALILYFAQAYIVFITVVFYHLYLFLFHKIKSILFLKKNHVITIFLTFFILVNSIEAIKIINKRVVKDNFDNPTIELDKFLNSNKNNEYIIVGDEISLNILISMHKNIRILLDDDYYYKENKNKNSKEWIQKNDVKIYGYFGLDKKNPIINGNEINFSQTKKIEDFYFKKF